MLLGGMEELPLRRGAERLRRLFDPLAIIQQRWQAGEPAATGVVIGGRRPTHDADHAAVPVERGGAGIAGAGAKAGARIARRRIDQANLQ